MDPATIISGVGSLVGAFAGKNRAARPSDTWRHTRMGLEGQASGAREFGEKYGFNPLALLGVSSPLQAQAVDNSAFGAGIANAALAVADGMNAQSAQKAYQEQLEQQNKELRKALDGATVRPKMPGIFGTVQPVAGVAEPATVPVVPSITDFNVAASLGYPDRLTEVAPVKDLAVLANVEMPGGESFPVPHDGDEIMGLEKVPIFAMSWFANEARKSGRYWRERFDNAGLTDPDAWLLPKLYYEPGKKKPKEPGMFGIDGF